MECDTDSLYIAFAKDTIDECVKPHLKEEWGKVKHKFFSSESNEPMSLEVKLFHSNSTINEPLENTSQNSKVLV